MIRPTPIAALVVLLLLASFKSARATEIVFDPTNFAANVEQVLHHLEVIARLEEQIRNQYRMLENWRFTRINELLATMLAIRQPLDAAGALDLAHRYPILTQAYARRDAEAMRLLRQQWLEAERKELIQAQTLQSQVVKEMPATQSRVAEYVQRSNSAPGQTAVLQASNEMLATLAGQLQALQALEVSQMRIELEEDARRQAEEAFQQQRRTALMGKPAVTAPSKSGSSAFLFAKSEGK